MRETVSEECDRSILVFYVIPGLMPQMSDPGDASKILSIG